MTPLDQANLRESLGQAAWVMQHCSPFVHQAHAPAGPMLIPKHILSDDD